MDVISKIDAWSEEDRYNLLVQMDYVVRANADFYAIHHIWDDYGGGRKATSEWTESNRKEIAKDNDKFLDALQAFVTSLLFDQDWEFRAEEKGNEN